MKLSKMLTALLSFSAPASKPTKQVPDISLTNRSLHNDNTRFEDAADLLVKGPDGYVIEPEDSFDLNVVGESFYQSNIEKITGPRSANGANFQCFAKLICDKENPKDRNAVSVRIDGLIVGHLSKYDARAWRNMLKKAGAGTNEVTVAAEITGGWRRVKNGSVDEGSFGVKLDVPVTD